MTEDFQVLQALAKAKYVEGSGTLEEVDCWGVIEVAYEMCPSLGISLLNRKDLKPGSLGLYKAWRRQGNFLTVVGSAQNFDILMMTSIVKGRSFIGHCGLMYNKHVLHAESEVGVLFEPLNSPQIQCRKANVIRHASRT